MKKSFLKKVLGTVVFVLLVLGAGFLGKLYKDYQSVVEEVHEEIVVEPLREVEVEINEGEPLNILLLGTDANRLERDEAEGYVSRSDSMILLTINPSERTTTLLSIPRDTIVSINGQTEPDKINHAFAFGGAELAVNTVQNFLNVPVDFYATVNMSGLEEIIDAIGGIEVTSPLTFEYRGTGFVKGEKRHVNGVKAMNFARMRYSDPEGEIGRQNRQKIVIKAIIDKVLSLDGINAYGDILKVVKKNIRTNFDLSQILSIYPKYIDGVDNIRTIRFENIEELYLDEVFYFYISKISRAKVSNEMRQLLGLRPITVADLADPFSDGDDGNIFKDKTLTLVVNQYPSGVSQAELERIARSQQNVLEARQNEYQSPNQGFVLPELPAGTLGEGGIQTDDGRRQEERPPSTSTSTYTPPSNRDSSNTNASSGNRPGTGTGSSPGVTETPTTPPSSDQGSTAQPSPETPGGQTADPVNPPAEVPAQPDPAQ